MDPVDSDLEPTQNPVPAAALPGPESFDGFNDLPTSPPEPTSGVSL